MITNGIDNPAQLLYNQTTDQRNARMSKIKVSELFYSIQGEGKYMGVPSVFLRTFGCNFRCQGFGRVAVPSNETHNPEVAAVIQRIGNYKSYNELPLVTTGCDSYAAVYPEFKNFSPMVDTDTLAQQILDLLPNKTWHDEHLIITGGEPLLGWQRAYPALLDHPSMANLTEITFETNGTQPLSPEFRQYLANWDKASPWRHVTFSVSAKLPCSGEAWDDAIKPAVVCDYETVGSAYLKFVIATEQDFADAERAIAEFQDAGFTGPVYLMPIGGIDTVYAMNNRRVADLALKNGLRYSDRLQVPLYKNAWGT
jgi:7-carboxy-7-deazaguanine synthase